MTTAWPSHLLTLTLELLWVSPPRLECFNCHLGIQRAELRTLANGILYRFRRSRRRACDVYSPYMSIWSIWLHIFQLHTFFTTMTLAHLGKTQKMLQSNRSGVVFNRRVMTYHGAVALMPVRFRWAEYVGSPFSQCRSIYEQWNTCRKSVQIH